MNRPMRVLAEGFHFGEGPRWHEDRLWFSDQWADRVYSVSLRGDLRVEFELDDGPSGLGWMPDGSLLVVSMANRCVLRRWPRGEMTQHADLSSIATGRCNDMVVAANGRAYVGNFGFDLEAEIRARGSAAVFADHPTANLAEIAPDGTTRIAATEMHFPNGSVITPDGKTLIVGETFAGVLTAFTIAADGSLSDRRVWAKTLPRVPDGIALDETGALWMANPMAPKCVRIAAGGAILEIIATDLPCFACMLGGDDGQSLFMLTAKSFVRNTLTSETTGRLLVTKVDHRGAGHP